KTSTAYVYYDDSFAMAVGATSVRLNGILVGKVTAIDLSGDDRPNRSVRVTLALNTEHLQQIPVDSRAKLAQKNLLGERYINISRGKSKETLQPGGEIGTGDTLEIQDMLDKGATTLDALQDILKRVENIVVEI